MRIIYRNFTPKFALPPIWRTVHPAQHRRSGKQSPAFTTWASVQSQSSPFGIGGG